MNKHLLAQAHRHAHIDIVTQKRITVPKLPKMPVLLQLIVALSLPCIAYAPAAIAQTTGEHTSESSAPVNPISEKSKFRIQVLNRALEQQPNNINLYNSRGWYYFQLGEYEKSLLDYDRVIKLGTENLDAFYQPSVYYVRGLSLLKLDKEKSAIRSLENAAKLYKSQNNPNGFAEVRALIERVESKTK